MFIRLCLRVRSLDTPRAVRIWETKSHDRPRYRLTDHGFSSSDRNVRVQLSRVARDLLSREVQYHQDARVLCGAFSDGRNQLHLLSDSNRETAGRMGCGDAGELFVHLEGAAADYARFKAAALCGIAPDVLRLPPPPGA